MFIGLFLAFIATIIIGTITHELGHFLTAKYFGYEAEITYAYTYYPVEIISHRDRFIVMVGGPLQTILTGSIGFSLILFFRKSFYVAQKLNKKQWIMIFISLFWLRPLVNLCTWLGGYFITGEFGTTSDEYGIAEHLHIQTGVIIGVTALIGAIVLATVFFKFIPVKQWKEFVLAGLTGGVSGYVLWIVLLGKYIMP